MSFSKGSYETETPTTSNTIAIYWEGGSPVLSAEYVADSNEQSTAEAQVMNLHLACIVIHQ